MEAGVIFSRKLGGSQLNWVPREKETYAIVAALRKWAGVIGYMPVTVYTDHKALEHWVTEHVDTPRDQGVRVPGGTRP